MDLQPAAGRAFEPAAATSIETAYVVQTLLEAYGTFRDQRLLDAAGRAEEWLTASETGPETWSRFYEIGTNRPVSGDRDWKGRPFGSTSISEERRNGYRWVGRFPDVIRGDPAGAGRRWTEVPPTPPREAAHRARRAGWSASPRR